MLRSLYVTMIYISFLVFGMAAPFVLSLGYVWVDTFRPQQIATGIITSFPVSAMMGALAIGSYIMFDRRAPARFSMHTFLTLMLAVWVTVTTALFAVSAESAWEKWDWAFKTILFSAFIPLVFRSMVQIEAFLQVYVFSLAIHILPGGLKTIVSGGGYGMDLGITGGNSGYSEGSTLAGISLMLIPIILYFRNNTMLIPTALRRYYSLGCLGLVGIFLACAIGTYARTAVVGLAVLAAALWWRSERKIIFACVAVVVALGLGTITSQAWEQRINTISDYQNEGSALGRIMVWRWTLGFVVDHPTGGGFNSFEVNSFEMPDPNGEPGATVTIRGKAFHSVYFEVLGEQGWLGAILYGGLIFVTLLSLHNTAKRFRNVAGMSQARNLAYALQVSFITMLVSGLFIGVAFQPMIFYQFAIAACLANYTRRCAAELEAALPVRPIVAQPAYATGVVPPSLTPAAGGAISWRDRARPVM